MSRLARPTTCCPSPCLDSISRLVTMETQNRSVQKQPRRRDGVHRSSYRGCVRTACPRSSPPPWSLRDGQAQVTMRSSAHTQSGPIITLTSDLPVQARTRPDCCGPRPPTTPDDLRPLGTTARLRRLLLDATQRSEVRGHLRLSSFSSSQVSSPTCSCHLSLEGGACGGGGVSFGGGSLGAGDLSGSQFTGLGEEGLLIIDLISEAVCVFVGVACPHLAPAAVALVTQAADGGPVCGRGPAGAAGVPQVVLVDLPLGGAHHQPRAVRREVHRGQRGVGPDGPEDAAETHRDETR